MRWKACYKDTEWLVDCKSARTPIIGTTRDAISEVFPSGCSYLTDWQIMGRRGTEVTFMVSFRMAEDTASNTGSGGECVALRWIE
jgi:hypothetical protein